ncbi:hypothetical protein SUGI_0419200 [Cryptomeria japonica]|nr:hypothetical protein SUGI_0419200 [Cryptomeria japonica]
MHAESSPSKQWPDWKTRLDIALNAAQGLEYLHSGCNRRVIHRDIKPANILLCQRMEAKIADFGMSTCEATHASSKCVGTRGYVDPEYNETWISTDKSDVYSFGIVILEIISGRKPNFTNSLGQVTNILCWSRPMISAGDIESLIDEKAGVNIHLGAMLRVAKLAMSCTEKQQKDRPTMNFVVSELREALHLHHTIDGEDDGIIVQPNYNPIAV